MLKKEKESAAPTYISFDRKDKGASFLGATDRKEKVKIKELVLFLLVPITSSWRAKRKKKKNLQAEDHHCSAEVSKRMKNQERTAWIG